MRRYLFHAEGLGREIWSDPAVSEHEAHRQVWRSLEPDEQNRVACLDCIDESDARDWPPIEMQETAAAAR